MNSKLHTILNIDDDYIDRLVNTRLLERFADRTISLSSAAEGLNFLKENENKQENLPDVILLDIRMPEMNGFEFLKEYKKLGKSVIKKPRIFLLTSSIDERDKKRASNNKFICEYFVKPLDLGKINHILEYFNGNRI